MTDLRPAWTIRQRAAWAGQRLLIEYGLLPILLICFYLGFAFAEPRFATGANLINILQQSSFLTIFAIGQTFVLLTRGFDLSVGQLTSTVSIVSTLAMAASFKGNSSLSTLAIFVGCAVGLGVGITAGVLNGLCVSFLRITPFVATLGMQSICFGLATTLSGGFPVVDIPPAFAQILSQGRWLAVPAPIWISLVLIALAEACMKFTLLGRAIYFMGGNPRAAYIAGLPTRLYVVAAYAICSTFVAIGALLLTARTGSGEPTLGGDLMLQSIAAAVIGGVSLRGGEGRIIHAVFGSVFVTILSVGMNLNAINYNAQQVFLGIIVVAAVYADRIRSRALLRAH